MVRKEEKKAISQIMGIWPDANMKAYNSILPDYRKSNYEPVKPMVHGAGLNKRPLDV